MSTTPRRADGPFSRRALAALLGVGLGTFVIGLLLAAFAGDLFGERSAGHDSYSRSLVGYRALQETLERAGLPVVVTRSATAHRSRFDFPLLLLEPLATDGQTPYGEKEVDAGVERLRETLAAAWRDDAVVVLVLPKWRAGASPRVPGWLQRLHLAPRSEAAEILAVALERGELEDAGDDRGDQDDRILRPSRDEVGAWRAAPRREWAIDLGESPQLISHSAPLEPTVETDAGILVGSWFPPGDQKGELLVISDPDLLNNQGLARGDNAALVWELLRHTLLAEGVIIDERLHGHTSEDSLVGRALRFPLVLLVLHGAITFALLGWSVSTRFGSPLPPPPALPPGKRLLIENTAALLQSARDHGDAVRRYLHMTEARVARRFSLPEGTSQDDLRARLARLDRVRGVEFDVEAVERAAGAGAVSAHEASRLAQQIHAWEKALMGDGEST